jgi:nicotinamide-nucleotide amidase
MESCTGGLLASALTDVPGSGYLLASAVCYEAGAKVALGVPQERISEFGVVSKEVASDMASATARLFGAEYGLSTTGVAGPGHQDGIPPGTVWLGLHLPGGKTVTRLLNLEGDREQVKAQAVQDACCFLLEHIETVP